MNKPKFDNIDRERVIAAVEGHYDIKLRKVGRRPKWRREDSGRNWWVMGGYDRWHAIPSEMMEAEEQNPTDGMLVVAYAKLRRTATDMEVFAGPVEQLVKARNKLSQTKERGDYQFVYKPIGTGNRIKIVGEDVFPIMHLDRFTSFSYEKEKKENDKETDQNVKEAIRQLNRLPPEERQRFLQNLQGRLDQTFGKDN